jgi:hypothetical protein
VDNRFHTEERSGKEMNSNIILTISVMLLGIGMLIFLNATNKRFAALEEHVSDQCICEKE